MWIDLLWHIARHTEDMWLMHKDDPKEQEKIDNALSHFALLAIRPVAFEQLELKPTPNIRTQWEQQQDGSWKEKHVAP